MSSEDVLARTDAVQFADGHTPMALEQPAAELPPDPKIPSSLRELEGQPVKRTRRTAVEIEADKLAREFAREAAKQDRARVREELKQRRAQERVQLKIDAQRAKVAEAEDGTVQLPAVVLRDGTVRHVNDTDAWFALSLYLDDMCLDCWAGETRVITRNGIKPIAELAGTEAELLIPSMQHGALMKTGKFRSVPVREFGAQELLEVTLTRHGEKKLVRATAGHGWFTVTRKQAQWGGEQRTVRKVTTELKAGDRLKPLKRSAGDRSVSLMPVAVAQGFVFGDGTKGGPGQAAYVDVYDSSPKQPMLAFFPGDHPRYDQHGGCVRVVNLPRFWKEIPPIRESSAFLLSWLSGYFAADGSISESGVCTLNSAFRENLEFVQDIAAACGIDYGSIVPWEVRNGFKEGTAYKLTLRRRDLPPWFFLLNEHASRAAAADEKKELEHYWHVASVERTGVTEPVYCAVVEGEHAFAMDGSFMSSNCETSGYPLGHQLYELRTVQLGGEECAVVFDAADSAQMEIASLALTLAKKLRAHSATADVIPCVVAGLIGWEDAWGKMQDSVLNAKLTDPKMSGSDADALKQLASDLLREYAVSPQAEKAKNELFHAMGAIAKPMLTTPPEKNGWYSVNKNSVVMTRYAGSDVLDLAAVLRVLPPIPVDESVMLREREFQAACATITLIGFKLDPEHIKAKIAEAEEAKADAQHNVAVLSGHKITNPKSPDVIKILPEIFPGLVMPLNRKTKRPSADSGSLEKVARSENTELKYLCKQILRYRQQDTKLGLLLRPFEALCEHGDGRGRTTIYTIEASTGRTSSRRFNAQQLSRRGGVRACIIAGEMNLELVKGQWEVAGV